MDSASSERARVFGRRAFLSRAMALGLGAGVVRATANATPAREVAVLQTSDLTALDPHGSTYSSDCRVSFNVFDTLVRRHPDGVLHPALATSWTRTGLTAWHLTLGQGVRWHDGTLFTSTDAKYSLDRTYDPSVKAARIRPMFQTIARAEAPEPGTLIIHTKRPDALIPAKLASYCGQIVPWGYIDRVGFTVFNERPVGTGPLRFVSWSRGGRCVLAANSDYWEGAPDVDRVVFRFVPDPQARVDALLRGEADMVVHVPPDQRARVVGHPATRVVGALYAGLYVLVVNVWVSPLNQPLVRQALSLAIDRNAIVKTLWRGRGVVPNGPIPAGDDYHERSLPPLPYDPSGARERLRRAGYAGEPVVLETTDGYIAYDKAMSEAIVEMWEDVGVKVVLEVIDGATRHRKNRQQTFKGLWWSDPTSITRDPDGMMLRLLSPGEPHDYWREPEFDRLAVTARYTPDEGVRADAYGRMTAIFLEHNPWIVVLQPYEDYGLRRDVEFTPNPDQQFELRRFNFRLRRA